MELSLKEKIIFSKYKDRPIENFKKFREQQSKKLGFPLSDELIRQLRIYQQNKYRKIQIDREEFGINININKKTIRVREHQKNESNANRKLEQLEKKQKTYVWSTNE